MFKSMWDKRVVPALQLSHFGACFLPLGFKQMPECVQMSVAVQCRWRPKESVQELVNVYLNQIISGHCISSKKSCFRSDFLHKQHTNYYSR